MGDVVSGSQCEHHERLAGLNVLIVEAEPVILQSLCELVSHWGHVPDEAENGVLKGDVVVALRFVPSLPVGKVNLAR